MRPAIDRAPVSHLTKKFVREVMESGIQKACLEERRTISSIDITRTPRAFQPHEQVDYFKKDLPINNPLRALAHLCIILMFIVLPRLFEQRVLKMRSMSYVIVGTARSII